MPNVEIVPAILVQDRSAFLERLRLVEGLVNCVQIDCMDGHFVNNRTWYEAGPFETPLEIELHLMVQDPLAVIHAWRRIPQVVRALWHVEIPVDHSLIIRECRQLGWECGLALSPGTEPEALAPYATDLDEVLVLGVEPGWSGQSLIPSTVDKAASIRKTHPELTVGFDGGTTRENLPSLIRAGATRINIASSIFKSRDPRQELRAILSSI